MVNLVYLGVLRLLLCESQTRSRASAITKCTNRTPPFPPSVTTMGKLACTQHLERPTSPILKLTITTPPRSRNKRAALRYLSLCCSTVHPLGHLSITSGIHLLLPSSHSHPICLATSSSGGGSSEGELGMARLPFQVSLSAVSSAAQFHHHERTGHCFPV